MAEMKEFLRLSLWDICHYWHGFNPSKTNPNCLPVNVQKSIRALTLKLSKTLYFKCKLNSISHRIFYQEHKPLRLLARDFQRKLKKVYSGKSYNKAFLQSLEVGRLSLLKWCQETNTKPPSFWFDEDDPTLNEPIEDNFSGLSEEEKRKHGYFAMFETSEENKQQQESRFKQSDKDNFKYTDVTEEKNLDKVIKDAISKMHSKNAKSGFKELDEHKRKFINFYFDNNYKYKSQAARDYFTRLSIRERKVVVKTYYESDHKNGQRNAVRNLTKALREYIRQQA